MTKKRRKYVPRKKLINHAEVTERLLLEKMFYQKVNILVIDRKIAIHHQLLLNKPSNKLELLKR